jgi:RNA polymerase sigma-70 factor (ECF subfamily)
VSRLDEAARRAAGGDAGAFAVLVRHTSAALFRLALRMTGNAQDAEDALQGAYASAHRALTRSGWDGRARVETWLYRIVCNASLNVRRERRRSDGRARAWPGAEATAPPQEAVVAVTRVMRLVQELPAEQRAALVLKELEGLTSREIAEIQGCSEGAVEQRLVRARATLRSRWNHE